MYKLLDCILLLLFVVLVDSFEELLLWSELDWRSRECLWWIGLGILDYCFCMGSDAVLRVFLRVSYLVLLFCVSYLKLDCLVGFELSTRSKVYLKCRFVTSNIRLEILSLDLGIAGCCFCVGSECFKCCFQMWVFLWVLYLVSVFWDCYMELGGIWNVHLK